MQYGFGLLYGHQHTLVRCRMQSDCINTNLTHKSRLDLGASKLIFVCRCCSARIIAQTPEQLRRVMGIEVWTWLVEKPGFGILAQDLEDSGFGIQHTDLEN